MKTWIAILVTISAVAGCAAIASYAHINLFLPLIVGTSVWAGIDSERIGLKKYQSGLSYGPVTLGILCSMLWIVAFPWYLSMRHKIISRTARLRPEYEPCDMGSGQMSPKGLVQPWHGRKI